MDMFKLLTRSTNLQKSASGYGSHNNQRIPSTGNIKPSKLEAQHDAVSVANNSSSDSNRKRRRTEPKEKQQLSVSQHLSFVNTGAKGAVLPTYSSRIDPFALQGLTEDSKKDNEEINEEIPDLNEHECRRLLKQHKLKITLLHDSDDREAINAKSRNSLTRPQSTVRNTDAQSYLIPQPLTSFRQLKTKYLISKRLAKNLDSEKHVHPTEVQMASLPILLGSDEDRGLSILEESRRSRQRSDVDLLTIAPTGSGKTLAFLIGTIHGLLRDRANEGLALMKKSAHKVRALVIVPTHELVDQIVNEGRKLAFGTGIKVAGMRKGMLLHLDLQFSSGLDTMQSEENEEGDSADYDPSQAVRNLVKTDILVSTPLMLLHAISGESTLAIVPLPEICYLVLDEADILLEPLFRSQTLGIWSACTNPSLQTSLWSATMGSSTESLAKSFILDRRSTLGLASPRDPSHCIVRIIVGLKDSAIPNISHHLIYAANEQGKLLALRQLIHPTAVSASDIPSIQPPFLIFTQTITRAVALHSELLYDISPEAGGSSRIAVLHSDLSDNARSAVMGNFRKGEIWVLITTDLLSRGVDFRGINGVVNYDIPNTQASYVHRVGRTGRQGREGGTAVTFYAKEDIQYLKNIANVIAASEKTNGKEGQDENQPKMAKWLLDTLPAVSKKTKKDLKIKGVESRRTFANGKHGKQARKTRISTKSGYDRRMENRRKGAVAGSQRRAALDDKEMNGSSGEEWHGIDE